MDKNNNEGLLIFLLFIWAANAFTTTSAPVVEKPKADPVVARAAIAPDQACRNDADPSGGQPRLRDNVLLEGGQLALPTKEYLEQVASRCDVMWGYGQNECRRLLGEVKKGRDDIDSRLNPIYGRGVFTPPQLAYAKWGAKRTIELLGEWEQSYCN